MLFSAIVNEMHRFNGKLQLADIILDIESTIMIDLDTKDL